MNVQLRKVEEQNEENDEMEENDCIEEKREEEEADDTPVDIINAQQDFYESFKDHIGNQSSHGYLEVLNEEVLKDVIGDPLKLYSKLSADEVNSLVRILWKQKKLTGTDHLKILQLFICCVHDCQNQVLSYPLNIKSNKFTIHPIYRIPKCFKNATSQGKCCAVFVDEYARVYKNWDDFKKNNNYNNCLIVAPKDGFYYASAEDKVHLDIFLKNNGVTKFFDTSSAVGSVASAAIIGVGLIPAVTLAPVVAATAVVGGTVCAVYTAGRSIYSLFDRKKHSQSIGLGNKESRAAYVNIGSTVLCAGSAAGAQLAKRAALNRQAISTVAQKAIRYVGIASLSLQTAGCADELAGMIHDWRSKKPINKVYLAQFGAQLFLLAFSYKNYRMTETLTEVSGSRNPKTIRKILRQFNSDGSLKYLYAGADLVDKNIIGISDPMMLKMVFTSCMNVAYAVKKQCEDKFNEIIYMRYSEYVPMLGYSNISLLGHLLTTLNFNSLDKFLKLSAQSYRLKCANINESFDKFVKIVYMTILKQNQENNMNTVISSFTEDSFDILTDEIISELGSTEQDLSHAFDTEFNDEICSGRKISLVIQFHCEEFVHNLQQIRGSKEKQLELLYDCVEDILKRIILEAATVFFGLVKTILNECVLQLPMHEVIRVIFQRLVKKFNGNLTLIEKELRTYMTNERKKDEFIRENQSFLQNRKVLELKKCSVCGGQGFN